MNFSNEVFMNAPADVRKLAGHMRDLGVTPEIEVYDAGHIDIAKRLMKEGLLKNRLTNSSFSAFREDFPVSPGISSSW